MRQAQFLPFYIGSARVGWLRRDFAEQLQVYEDVFRFDADAAR